MKNSPIATILASRIHGVLAEAEALQVLPHAGLRGRFRELALSGLISPLMPPSCVAIHGTAVDTEGTRFNGADGVIRTEDDVLVVDRDRVPALLFSQGEGVVPIEAVLARIEVKSRLTRANLVDAVRAAVIFRRTPLVLPDEDLLEGAAVQCSFAFGSDMGAHDEHARLLQAIAEFGWTEPVPPLQALCVVGKGFWFFGSRDANTPGGWHHCQGDPQRSEVIALLGVLMNSLPSLREKRKGARLGSHLIDVEADLRTLT